MHIDRIPVYRVYQRAIDLELYRDTGSRPDP